MNKDLKKALALLITASLAVGSIGCSLTDSKKGGKADKKAEAEAVEDVVSSFMDYVIGNKASKASKLVVDGEDVIAAATEDLDENELAIFNAILDYVEYEVSDAEGNPDKEEGSATVTISVPVVEVDGCSSMDEMMDLIEDADLNEEEVSIDLEYDDDYLIEEDSAMDILDVIVDAACDSASCLVITEPVQTAPSETELVETTATPTPAAEATPTPASSGNITDADAEGAIAAFDEFIATAATGDITAANALTYNTDDESDVAAFGSALIATYFSGFDYTAEVASISGNTVTLNVTGTAPDIAGAFSDMLLQENLSRVMAESLYAQLNNMELDDMQAELMGFVADVLVNGMNSRSSAPLNTTVEMINVNGEWKLVEGSGLMPDMEDAVNMDGVSEEDQLAAVIGGLEILHEENRISEEDYALYSALLNPDGLGGDGREPGETDAADIPADALVGESNTYIEGDSNDLFIMRFEDADGWSVGSYDTGVEAIFCHVTTMGYYPDGEFTYDVYRDGEYLTTNTTAIGDDTDEVYMNYGSEDGVADGDYAFVLYDYEADTILAICYVTVG